MALFTAGVIIRSLSIFHIIMAFLFLASPVTIANQILVQVLGEAMGMVGLTSEMSYKQQLIFLFTSIASRSLF